VVLSYYKLVILIFKIVPLLVESTKSCSTPASSASGVGVLLPGGRPRRGAAARRPQGRLLVGAELQDGEEGGRTRGEAQPHLRADEDGQTRTGRRGRADEDGLTAGEKRNGKKRNRWDHTIHCHGLKVVNS
jgi:hypothetical protein